MFATPCCACGGKNGTQMVLIEKKCKIPGHGWGCFTCGLPPDGAVAIVCDECMKNKVPPKLAFRGYPDEGLILVDELKEEFKHDVNCTKENKQRIDLKHGQGT